MLWHPPSFRGQALCLDTLPTGGRLVRVQDGRMGLLRAMLKRVGHPATVTLSTITISRAWSGQLRAMVDGRQIDRLILLADSMYYEKSDGRAQVLGHERIECWASKQHAKWTIVEGPAGRYVEHGSANFNGEVRDEQFWLDSDPTGEFCAELKGAFDAAVKVAGDGALSRSEAVAKFQASRPKTGDATALLESLRALSAY